ncbi:uncharacterized protein LOC126880744 [Diabrotica virgifera virgifera]|uniref:Uncharacterized protein n=1 Tax=Diabrotica virgifera virgifera TaxID=50390 RepID=A0ABM5JS31_DIAVI|nr:uncharacterized protein LOC126880744 [Diabrotica virgifera virgifera]
MTCKVEGCVGRYHIFLHDNSSFNEVQEKDEAVLQAWDDQVPDVIDIRFKDWLEELRSIPEIVVTRFYDVDLSKELQLYIFCDAIEEEFTAVVCVGGHARGSLSVLTIAGKGKVVRAKGMPIPRLELDAAAKRAKLKAYVEKAFRQELNFASSFLWIDSRTVMCWLTSRTEGFSQYVTNRVNLLRWTSGIGSTRRKMLPMMPHA